MFSSRCLPVVLLLCSSSSAQADLLLRAGAMVGGAYQSNVYLNASEVDDLAGLLGVRLEADVLASDAFLIKATYLGNLELYRQLSTERNYGQVGSLVFGLRPSDTLYLSLTTAVEHAYFAERAEYTFWGMFGRVGARLEVGESTTLRAGYQLRSDQFADYDLDNMAHVGDLSWESALTDEIEVAVPLRFEGTFYRERYLLDASGNPTSEKRSGAHWLVEPSLSYQPTFDLLLRTTLLGELNNSNDSYFYSGPFGATDPAVNPELINHFDSYYAFGISLSGRLQVAESLVAYAALHFARRGYMERTAFNANGLTTDGKQADTLLQPSIEVSYDLLTLVRVTVHYTLLKQWSNDALWDHVAHAVRLTFDFFWES